MIIDSLPNPIAYSSQYRLSKHNPLPRGTPNERNPKIFAKGTHFLKTILINKVKSQSIRHTFGKKNGCLIYAHHLPEHITEGIQSVVHTTHLGAHGLPKKQQIICKHQMKHHGAKLTSSEWNPITRFYPLGDEVTQFIHAQIKNIRRDGATLPIPRCGAKKGLRLSFHITLV